MQQSVSTVTKKGQTTIPKELRKKHKIGRKVLMMDTDAGILLKPIADPMMEKGSLKEMFQTKSSGELLEEARFEEKEEKRKLRSKLSGRPRRAVVK